MGPFSRNLFELNIGRYIMNVSSSRTLTRSETLRFANMREIFDVPYPLVALPLLPLKNDYCPTLIKLKVNGPLFECNNTLEKNDKLHSTN